MPLAEIEVEWVKWISGKKIDAGSIDANGKKNAAKSDFLDKVLHAQLETVRGEIDEAQGLIVKRTEDPGILKAAWRKLTNSKAEDVSEMKWRASDEDTNQGILDKYELRADVEIDTQEDIDEKTKLIEMNDLAKLEQSFQRIKQMEAAMRMQFDDEGQPLFTDEDIRNELYTPLVRSGLIPDNMVPDKFSEHAVAFKGAQEMYAKRIETFTATTSKTEQNLKTGFRIAKDVVTLGGALVSGSLTIANAPDIARKNEEIRQLNLQKENLPQGSDTTALDNQIKAAQTEVAELTNMARYAETGTAMLLGGLGVGEMIVEHSYTAKTKDSWAKWMKTISKGLELAQAMAVAAVETGIKGSSETGGTAEKGLITCVTTAMSSGFTGAKLVPSMVLIIQEPDEAKRAGLIRTLVADLGTVVGDAIKAAAANIRTEPPNGATEKEKADLKQADANAAAALNQIGAAIRVAITQSGNAPAIIRAYQAGDFKSLGLLLGGGAVATVFSASSEAIFDGIRKDESKKQVLERDIEDAPYSEVTGSGQEALQDTGSADIMEKISKEIAAFDKTVISGLKPGSLNALDSVPAEKLKKQLDGEIAEEQKKLAETRMQEALTPEAMREIMNDVDAKLVGFEKIYSDAFPDPDILKRTPEEIVQANAAIDRAMANTAELRQKVAIINGMVGGAAGVLAALVPGTGAVVAAAKLAGDLYALVKCVQTHNTWCDSMAVAMAGQGGSAAAIENTLHNAKIQLDKAAITAVLSALKVGAEVGKVFDPTGAAAGVSAGLSMASAVTEFAYKMHKESEIRKGWNAYKDALANPGNRKRARKALRLNSTLAKCCIAYGAAIMGDIAAQRAITASGLSIAALKNDKDICTRLVAYLENELVDDPVVMMVDYQKGKKWAPGTPALTLASWTAFKAAARKVAEPRMAEASLKTPGIDRLLANVAAGSHREDAKKLDEARKKLAEETDPKPDEEIVEDTEKAKKHAELKARLTAASDLLARLNQALLAFQPLTEGGSGAHEGMVNAAKTFATLARAEKKAVDANLNLLKRYPDSVA